MVGPVVLKHLKVAMVSLCLIAPSQAVAVGNANFTLGVRYPQVAFSEGLGTMWAASLDVSFGSSSWPAWVQLYSMGSRDEWSERIETTDSPGYFYAQRWQVTLENGLGVNRTWTHGRIHPYLAAGGMLVTELHGSTYGADEIVWKHGVGVWGMGGAFYGIGSKMNLGASVRLSGSNVEDDEPAGGAQVGLTLGWGWPAGR
jgi:hypothetical protein